MNKQKVEWHLRNVLKKWLNSISFNRLEPWPGAKNLSSNDLRQAIEKSIIVSGGSIVSLLRDEEVNDYDIYFDDVAICECLVKYYIAVFHQNCNTEDYLFEPKISTFSNLDTKELGNPGKILLEKTVGGDPDELLKASKVLKRNSRYYGEELAASKEQAPKPTSFDPMLISNRAITLQNKIQLVFTVCGKAPLIHYFFDFKHCMNDFTLEKGLSFNPESLECILTKELKYNRTLYPFDCMMRLKKLIAKGWNISNNELAKIMWDLTNCPKEASFYQEMFRGYLDDSIIDGITKAKLSDRNQYFSLFV